MSLLDKIEHSISLTNSSEEEKNVLRVMYCRQYLNNTDYTIVKMYENVIQGGSIIEMLKEYKEVLANRKEARQLINELENKSRFNNRTKTKGGKLWEQRIPPL